MTASYRVISYDFPTWYEPATLPEIYMALGWYSVALLECETELNAARSSYRVGHMARLEAYRDGLLRDRQIWLDALGDGGLEYAVPRTSPKTSPNRFVVGTNSEVAR